jgi:hypothetical protein
MSICWIPLAVKNVGEYKGSLSRATKPTLRWVKYVNTVLNESDKSGHCCISSGVRGSVAYLGSVRAIGRLISSCGDASAMKFGVIQLKSP